jgi:hypothetical protein
MIDSLIKLFKGMFNTRKKSDTTKLSKRDIHLICQMYKKYLDKDGTYKTQKELTDAINSRLGINKCKDALMITIKKHYHEFTR